MTIKAIVKAIIAALPIPGSFLFGWKSFQNFKADEEPIFPIRYMDSPIVSNDSLKQSGLIESDFPLTIFFGDKTALDWTPEQHDVIIQVQRAAAAKFITACQNHPEIHFVKSAKRTEMVNVFDLNLSGVVLEITLTPFEDGGVLLN